MGVRLGWRSRVFDGEIDFACRRKRFFVLFFFTWRVTRRVLIDVGVGPNRLKRSGYRFFSLSFPPLA